MQETIFSIKSEALANERAIWVRRPAEPAAAKHLVVFLDAELYRDRVGATGVIEELADETSAAWFVFVSMHSVEARWIECPCHRPFAAFVVEELLPELHRRYPELAMLDRTIAGVSYTGLAAAYVVHEYPGVFGKAICQSGSFWWNECWLVREYERLRQALPTSFFLDVGTRETQENVQHKEDVLQVVSQVEGVNRFREALRRTGHGVAFREFEGGHEFAGWKRTLPDALRWAVRDCRAPHAMKG